MKIKFTYKFFLIFSCIFITINIQANILGINASHNYNLFKNYKKIGQEIHKLSTVNDSNINLIMNLDGVSYSFLHNIHYNNNDYSKPKYLEFKVNNIDKSYYKFDSKLKFNNSDKYQFVNLPKKSYLFEPLFVTTIYPILKSKKKNINLFIPSKNKIVKAEVTFEGIANKQIGKDVYSLKSYNLLYENQSYEIYVDKLGVIVFVDWSSLGYYSEIDKDKIISLENIKIKRNYKIKINKVLIGGFPVKIYRYISKKNNHKSKNILIIDGTMFPRIKNAVLDDLAENIFIDKLIDKLSTKGYSVLRYSFEDFNVNNFESLTLYKKYNIVKKIFSKNKKYNTLITVGWGSLIALKLNKEFTKKIKKIIFLNPIFENYLKMLENQSNLEFFSLKKQKQLKMMLKKLVKQVYSKDKVSFNGMVINTDYFKQLFKEDTKKYINKLKNGVSVSIFTGSYDSEINSKNGWLLYSSIKTNENNIKHREFVGLNHYFHKIPYKSFAFSYNKKFNIDRYFLKELKRFLRR